MAEILYGRTQQGQLLYDLAFTNLLYDLAFTNLRGKYLARKHGLSIATIRSMRARTSIKRLRRQNRLRAVVE